MRSALLVLACWAALAPGQGRTAELSPWRGGAKPPLRLDLLGGGTADLPPEGEGPVIVHFFATWCPACVPELAALDRLAAARPDLKVIAVDVGEVPARLGRFLAAHPARFPVALDPDLAAARAWDVAGLPASFVFAGPGGAPRLAADGDVAWDGAAARAALDALKRGIETGGAGATGARTRAEGGWP